MITLKVPNVLDPQATQQLLAAVDEGKVLMVMEPDGEVSDDDRIGLVKQVADLGVDFEVMVELEQIFRYVPSAGCIFAVNPQGVIYLVQKEPWSTKAS